MAKVFTECAACACKQAHVPRFAALVGIDRVDEPDRLSFSILRVDADPCRPHVVLDKGAQRRAHGCGQVRGVPACFTALVNVHDEDGGVLLVGQHCILALGEGLRLNAIHPRAEFANSFSPLGASALLNQSRTDSPRISASISTPSATETRAAAVYCNRTKILGVCIWVGASIVMAYVGWRGSWAKMPLKSGGGFSTVIGKRNELRFKDSWR